MALNKQVWVNQLMKNYYPAYLFLTYAQDFSNLVENDKIHIPEMGADPVVLINNTTYPINVTERVDTDQEITLDTFETENTMVRDAEAIEMAYDKVESVIYGHKNTLQSVTATKAAHAFAPAEHTADTPVLLTTGADDGTGRKRLLPSDILKLKKAWDLASIPQDDFRILVLCPEHVEDLIEFDLKAFKDVANMTNGEPTKFGGFKLLQFPKTPRYNVTTKVRLALDAVSGNASSFAFHKYETMKADGTIKMYANIDDAKERATILGFMKRFVAMNIRGKGTGAIVSANV